MTFLGSHQKAQVVGQIITLKSDQQVNIKRVKDVYGNRSHWSYKLAGVFKW